MDLVDSPATAKNLPSKISILNSDANFIKKIVLSMRFMINTISKIIITNCKSYQLVVKC